MLNEEIVLAKRPVGLPTAENFAYRTIEIEEPKEGEVLLETLYLSVDPYMRSKMTDEKSYTAAYELDKAMYGGIVARVIKSESAQLEVDDIIISNALAWRRYNTVKAEEVLKVPNKEIPLHLYLGALGLTGHTAYEGLMQIGKPQEGETVVVSAAAGAVGSVVGQIAKLKGCKVVGIAGGSEKTAYIKDELGFDAAVDYKADDFKEQLAAALPNGVDVYFENVGGEVSDEVFTHLNDFARVPVCGAISAYNKDRSDDMGYRVQRILIKKKVLMQGFIVTQFSYDFENARKNLAQWIAQGEIKTKASIVKGFENVPEAFLDLFEGRNFGKHVVEVKPVQ